MRILGGRAVRRSVGALAREAGLRPLRVAEEDGVVVVHVALGGGPQDHVGFFRAVGVRHPGLRVRLVAETTKPRR